MKRSPIDFSGTLAASAASMDWLWAIEPMFARQAWFRLQSVDATTHRNAYEQNGEKMGWRDSYSSGILPEEIRENHEAFLDAMNIGDTSGAGRQPFGVNADGSRKSYPVDGGVALLAITGVMQKADAYSMEDATSTVRARRVVRQAMNDGDIKAVLIRFDTPGGTVAGNDDLATDVRKLAQMKPTYAYCEDLCASAGYYVASQCNAIYANSSALIGSVSSLLTTYDYSAMFEAMGVESVVITPDDAPYKGTGAMGSVLTDAQRNYLKGIVTDSATQFRNAVKRGRGFSDEQLAAIWDGRVFPAKEARSLKLIDGITSYDNVLATLKRVKTD
jgi:signal peptide peptidase SppA